MVLEVQGVLKDTQMANDKLQKEYNLLTDKVSKMQQTLEEHIHTNTQVGIYWTLAKVLLCTNKGNLASLPVGRLDLL